jgi:hypothetical protein
MEDSIQNDKPAESATSTDQTQKPATAEQRTQPTPSSNGVFLMRAEGQSFEEFKEFCVKRFREAGLLKD